MGALDGHANACALLHCQSGDGRPLWCRYSLWWLLQPKHAAHRDDEHSDRILPAQPAVFEQPEWRQVTPEHGAVDAIGNTLFSFLEVLTNCNPLAKKKTAVKIEKKEEYLADEDDLGEDGDDNPTDLDDGVPNFPIGIFNPRSLIMLYWNLIILILVCYNLVICPMRFSFEYMQLSVRLDSPFAQPGWGFWNSQWLWIEYAVDAFFALDVIVQLSTAFFREYEGEFKLVVDRSEVTSHHLKRWFVVDLAVGFPFEFLHNYKYHLGRGDLKAPKYDAILARYCRVVKFLKLKELSKITRVGNLDHHISSLRERIALSQGPLRVIKFLVAFLYTLHVVSCMLFAVARAFDDDIQDSWIQHVGMMVVSSAEVDGKERTFASWRLLDDPSLSWSNQYLASFYYMTTTLTQVGYGDFLPVSFYEVMILSVAMVAGVADILLLLCDVALLGWLCRSCAWWVVVAGLIESSSLQGTPCVVARLP